MQRCLQLAECGRGLVEPNPVVGCVIVYKNKIIGEGYHEKFGGAHAEVNAINSVKNKNILSDSELYVSLEPCCYQGKTPACTNLISSSGIKKVYIAVADPNEKVSGKGISILRENNISVEVGILENDATYINRKFFYYHQKKLPYVLLKWAETRNGYISSPNEKKISNIFSDIVIHKLRSEYDTILIGTNTAENDNPKLNTRLWKGKNPARIILDATLRLPQQLNIFDGLQKTFIVTDITKTEEKKNSNAVYLYIDFRENIAEQMLKILFENNIHSVLIEGGTKTLQTFIDAKMYNEIYVIKSEKEFEEGMKAPIFLSIESEVTKVDSDVHNVYYKY